MIYLHLRPPRRARRAAAAACVVAALGAGLGLGAVPASAATGPLLSTSPSSIPDQGWVIGVPIQPLSVTASPQGQGCTVIADQTGFGLPPNTGLTESPAVMNSNGSATVTLSGTPTGPDLLTGTLTPAGEQMCNGAILATHGTPFNYTISTPFQANFQVSDGAVQDYSSTFGTTNTSVVAEQGTNLATAGLALAGGYETAYVDANGDLALTSTGTGEVSSDTGHAVAAGTSPAITALTSGGFEGAFVGGDNNLWTFGADGGTVDTGLGVFPGTSPAITALPDNGFQVAFHANAAGTAPGDLYLYGTGPGSIANHDTGLGLASGTSPAITALTGGGFEGAFAANGTNLLWTFNSTPAGTFSFAATNLGVDEKPGQPTSPAITALPGGGFQVAFHANAAGTAPGDLYLYGTGPGSIANHDTGLGLDAGTSPAITALTGGGFEGAFAANGTNDLWTFNSAGSGSDSGTVMAPGTSPAIASPPLAEP